MKHRLLASIVCAFVLALGSPHAPALAAMQPEQAEPETGTPPEEAPEGEPEPEGEEALPEEEPVPDTPQVPPEALPPPPSAPEVAAPPPAPPQATAAPAPVPAPPAAPAEPTGAPVPAPPPAPPAATPLETPAAPRDIAKIQDRLRAGPVGQDPTAVRLMDLIDRGATAKDYDSFAVYLAKRNLLLAAESYAKVAVKLEKTNRDYWLNLGTIDLQINKLSSALTAYKKAKKLDPNDAVTWYSIGAVHDYMRNYDKAVEAFTVALALDPSLGEFKTNPQAVNNGRLLVVNLLLYQARAGGLAMPLRGGPGVADKPAQPASRDKTTPR